jgi:hypothetical protein
MCCLRAFPGFVTSDGWPIGSGDHCFNFAVSCSLRRRNRNRPPQQTSQLFKNVRSAMVQCVSLNVSCLKRLIIRQGPQCPSSSIPLNQHFNRVAFHAFWRALWTCAFISNEMFFRSLRKDQNSAMYRPVIAANTNFSSTSAWSLSKPANSAIQSP